MKARSAKLAVTHLSTFLQQQILVANWYVMFQGPYTSLPACMHVCLCIYVHVCIVVLVCAYGGVNVRQVSHYTLFHSRKDSQNG